MECPECLLRFTLSEREPMIQHCGHTICKQCIPKLQACPTCNTKLPPQKDNNKPNYSLLEIIQKDTRQIDKFIKVCFVGSSGVGKTSLIRMLSGKGFLEDISTTVGYDFMYIDRQIDGYQVRFQLWDSAGQQRYRAISPIHYKNSNIIVIVYNVCSDNESNQIMNWINETEKHAPEEAKKILIGNKVDMIENKVFQPLNKQAWQLIQKDKINRVETSCKSKAGIEQFWALLQYSFTNRKTLLNRKNIADSPRKITSQINNRKSFETSIPLKRKQHKTKQISSTCC